MIQFNLLPSVKAEYIKAQRLQRTVMVVSGLVTAVAVFLFILLIVVNAFQKHVLNNLVGEVNQDSAKLQQIPDLNQILTVQNQLESLPALHSQKAVVSRLLGDSTQAGYLTQITPSQVTISDIKADFTAHTLTISGEAPTLDVVNTYVDTLKFTTYSTSDGKVKNASAFTDVALSSFGRDSQNATYTITLNYNPDIFNENESVSLTVPNIITSRSIIDQPGVTSTSSSSSQPLFKQASP